MRSLFCEERGKQGQMKFNEERRLEEGRGLRDQVQVPTRWAAAKVTEEETSEWLQICAGLTEFPGRLMAKQNGAELPNVADLIILIVFLVLVVLHGSSGVDPSPSLLLPAPAAV